MLKIMLKFYFEIHIFSFSNPSIGINCFNKVNVKNTPKNFIIVKRILLIFKVKTPTLTRAQQIFPL